MIIQQKKMLHIIGDIVIAMNDYYWNEYIKKDINERTLINILKLYQSSTRITELKKEKINSSKYGRR